MKRHRHILQALAWGLLVCLLLVTLCACSSSLSGTYVSQGLIAQSFTFDGDHVTMSAFGLNVSGTYEIQDDTIIIHYSLFGLDYDWEQSFSRSGKTITIGGTDFTKS